jgi:cytochrome b subunit of formate dehydrogenase
MSSSIGVSLSRADAGAHAGSGRYYRRFGLLERVMHAVLMFTFIGCALSGLPLLYPDHAWAEALVRLFGGFRGAGLIHRICAAVMIVVFVGHVLRVLYRGLASGSLLTILWGPDSMVPQGKDIADIYNHFRWFLGRGPRPQFDRYTYWEKFDYWAVFWGMFIIGGSGLMLWFPIFFSQLVPGWVLNITSLVHGEEALLAVGFIFTIHFFNGHLRPEKFPMDLVIFTGRVSEHDLVEERPIERARLVREGRLTALETTPPSAGSMTFGRVVGGTALTLGIVTIILIFYGILR